jgi:hypothetical protein
MKTITLHAIALGKKMVITLVMALFTISIATANNGDSTITNETASVSCLKVTEGQVFFNVKFENADGGRFHLLVNDANGDNLYHGTFTGKNFDRVFRAPVENGKLTIIIRDMKDKTNHIFELTNESKLVQQIYVKRM